MTDRQQEFRSCSSLTQLLGRAGVAGMLFLAQSAIAEDVTGPSLPSRPAEPTVVTAETKETSEPPADIKPIGPVQTASLVAPGEPKGLEPLEKPVPEPSNAPVVAADGEAGFLSLFDETGLNGWQIHEGRPGTWTKDDNVIRGGGVGVGWLMSEKSYSDFVLKLEYRLAGGTNSGVAIRCLEEGSPTFTGMEIQLIDDNAPKYANLNSNQYTGSLYYRIAPQTPAKLVPDGEWNECEIQCIGQSVRVSINGQVVNDITLRDDETGSEDEVAVAQAVSSAWSLAERPPVGRIALQGHPAGVEFRNVRIRNSVTELESGLGIVDLTSAQSELSEVSASDTIQIHYVGQLEGGKIFTNSYPFGKPVTVALEDVIQGWKEGIVGMKPGDRRRLIVPPGLAYGEQGVENLIPPNATLVFEVELQGVER
ncbi:MAG: family 16 glycoside hydrolase [Planctomycetaceae bacterium]